MDSQSNQDGNTAGAFLEHFAQRKLECQQKYLSDIKWIFGNQEAREIFLDLRSYVCSYESSWKMDDNFYRSEKIEINKPINEISKSEIPSDELHGGKRIFFAGTNTDSYVLLHEEKQKKVEKILDNNDILKNSSPEYRKKLICSCATFALNTIFEQKSMKNFAHVSGVYKSKILSHFGSDFELDIDIVAPGDIPLSFVDINLNSMLYQNTDNLWQDSDVEDYVDNEKYDGILKDMLTCPDFVRLIDSFNIGADNGIWRGLNEVQFKYRVRDNTSGLSQEELNLLKAFSELRYMNYSNIKKSITESALGKNTTKKLYKMMAWTSPSFCIFEDIKSIIDMYADGVLSFKEVIQTFKSDDNSLKKMRMFAIILDRYLCHDYDAYLENYVGNQSKHNNYKTLQDAVLDLIDCIATENNISAERVNGFKEMVKSACNVNIFGVIIQFVKNLFSQEENMSIMWNYENIKLDRLASNIMKILPEILTTIYRDDTAVIDDEDRKKEVQDIQIVKIVSLEENNIIPKQSSSIDANNIGENEKGLK